MPDVAGAGNAGRGRLARSGGMPFVEPALPDEPPPPPPPHADNATLPASAARILRRVGSGAFEECESLMALPPLLSVGSPLPDRAAESAFVSTLRTRVRRKTCTAAQRTSFLPIDTGFGLYFSFTVYRLYLANTGFDLYSVSAE